MIDRRLVQRDVERRRPTRDEPHDRVDLAAGRLLASHPTARPVVAAAELVDGVLEQRRQHRHPSRTPPGEPGSVTTRASPIVPATPRESTEVGTCSRDTARSASAMPGHLRSSSGVDRLGRDVGRASARYRRWSAPRARPRRARPARRRGSARRRRGRSRRSTTSCPASASSVGQQLAAVVGPLAAGRPVRAGDHRGLHPARSSRPSGRRPWPAAGRR